MTATLASVYLHATPEGQAIIRRINGVWELTWNGVAVRCYALPHLAVDELVKAGGLVLPNGRAIETTNFPCRLSDWEVVA